MWRTPKGHLWALALLVLTGSAAVVGVRPAAPGVLGTRFTGYGALALLCAALAIGPLARLWPALFSRLLAVRRAMGIWSAAAAAVHLLYVLQLMRHPLFGPRSLVTLFFQEMKAPYYAGDTVRFITVYRVAFTENLTAVAWTGGIAFLVLALLAFISNDLAQRLLGHSAWKLLQQQAYTAMLFASLHILLMRFGGKTKLSPPLLPALEYLLLAVLLLQAAGFLATVRRTRERRPPAPAAGTKQKPLPPSAG